MSSAFEAIANFLGLDRLRETFEELVINTVLNIDTFRANTGLAGVAVLGCHSANNSCIKVSVIKDDERGVATQFHGDRFDRLCALLNKDFANFG